MKKTVVAMTMAMILGGLNPMRAEAVIRPDVPEDNPRAVLLYSHDECVGEDIFRRGLCLPSDNKMTTDEQDQIIEVIRSCF